MKTNECTTILVIKEMQMKVKQQQQEQNNTVPHQIAKNQKRG